MYNLAKDQEFLGCVVCPKSNKDQLSDQSDDYSTPLHSDYNSKNENMQDNWTISPNKNWFRVLKVIKILGSFYLAFLYPFLANRHEIHSNDIMILAIFESIFLVHLILNFFLQPINEAGQVMNLSRKQISKRYFYGNFGFDAFMLFPHGIFYIFDYSLGSLWMLKTLRIRDLY